MPIRGRMGATSHSRLADTADDPSTLDVRASTMAQWHFAFSVTSILKQMASDVRYRATSVVDTFASGRGGC